jgi:hypothetical protein
MKHIRTFMIFSLLAIWSVANLTAQTCFVKKTDPSGFNVSDQLHALEQAACNLKNTFPEPFKSQFKVIDAAYYLHNPVMKDASLNLWDYLKQEASNESPYYLLVAREITTTEFISRFRVDVKFPTTGEFDCVTAAKIISLGQQVEAVMNQKYLASGKSPYQYPNAEIEGMKVLQDEVFRFVDCCLCCQNRPEQKMMSDSCSQCTFSGDAMAGYLKSLGFAEYADAVVTVSSQTYSLPLESQHKVDVQIRGVSIALTDELNSFLSSAQTVGTAKARVKVFNDVNCNDFESYSPLSHSGIYTEDIVVIDRGGTKRIFYKITEEITGNPAAAKNENIQERQAVLPVLAVWLLKRAAMAAVNVATHLLTETALEYYFGDHVDFWAAWGAVDLDWWEVIEAGAEGIIGANNIKVQMLMGACRQTVDYLLETPYGQIDPWQIGGSVLMGALTGALNYYIDSGTEKFQGLLNKYGPDIAVKSFKKLGVHQIFFKFKSFRRTYINIVWKKAKPTDRGWLIEEALKFSSFKGWNWVGPSNGPGDFLTNGWASQVKSIAKANPVQDWSNIKTHLDKGCDQLIVCLTKPQYAQYNIANLRLDIVIPSSEAVHYNALLQKVRGYIAQKYPNSPQIQQMLNDQKVIIGTFLE